MNLCSISFPYFGILFLTPKITIRNINYCKYLCKNRKFIQEKILYISVRLRLVIFWEGKHMTDTVDLNTNLSDSTALYNTGNLAPASVNVPSGTTGSVFNSDPLSLFSQNKSTGFGSSSIFPGNGSSNFQDDILMSGFDFDSLVYDPNTQTIMRDKTQQAQNQIQAQGQTAQTAVAQGQSGIQNANGNTPNFSELDNYLIKDTNTNTPANSNIGKAAGAAIGCSLPLAENLLTGIKSGKFLKGLNWKQLAVTCPVVGLAGFGIGYVVDKLINQFKQKPETQLSAGTPGAQQGQIQQQPTVLPQAA